MTIAALLLALAAGSGFVVVSYILWQCFCSPLSQFPGPFAARFTNLWRAIDVACGRPDITQKALHQQYGSAVRLGPNFISLSDPELKKTIYNVKGNFEKSAFYNVNDVKVGSKIVSTVFGVRSNADHAAQMKPIQRHYTLGNVLTCEPLVDRTTKSFLETLDKRFAADAKPFHLDEYLLYYSWDVISEMTFGAPLSFLDKGTDIENILKDAESSLDYFAVVGQMPWLDFLLDKNPIHPIGPGSYGAVVRIAFERTMQRLKEADTRPEDAPKDFLDFFIDKKDAAIEKSSTNQTDVQQIIGWLMINLMAGADTTAATLRSIFYFVMKNPTVYRKLRDELAEAGLTVPVAYKAAQSLPYLSAVVREACRMCPGVGLPLERIVPAEGLELPDGRYIPAGTIVGMNAWVVHGDKDVYGQDADSFNPSRWLRNVEAGETEDEFSARSKRMRDAELTFGGGNRICAGRHVSMLEIYKVTATLLLRYNIQLTDPKREWDLQNSWFVRQSGIEVTIERRDLLNRHRAAHWKTDNEPLRKRTGRACEACIKAKTKCEEQRPCARCKSRDQICQESEGRRTSINQAASPDLTDDSPSTAQGGFEQFAGNGGSHAYSQAFNGYREATNGIGAEAIGNLSQVGSAEQPLPTTSSSQMEEANLLLGLNSRNLNESGLGPSQALDHDFHSTAFANADVNFPDFFEQIMMPEGGGRHQYTAPFDISNFTQDLPIDSCDFDFSLLSTGLTRPSTASGHRQGHTNRTDETPHSDIHLRTKAFEESPWSWSHWIPERYSHAFSGQEEINVQENRVHSADQLTSPASIRIMHFDIEQPARDRMIRVVTKVAHRHLAMPSFPSLELLEDLLDVFISQDSNEITSFIHAGTFNSQTARTELLLASVAAGARFVALPQVWKMGLVIQEVVRLAIADVFESDNSTTRELQAVQTMYLWLHIGAFSGLRRKTEIALSFLQSPITMLSWSNAFKRSRYKIITPDLNDSDDELEAKWRAWAEQESLKRLIIAFFILDSQVAIVNMKNALISPAQMQVPLPASRDMWLAPNAHAWRNVYYGVKLPDANPESLTMLDFFGNNVVLQQLGNMVDHRLCMLAACHGLGHEVWSFRQHARLLVHWKNQGRRDRWLAHQTQQRDLNDDLSTLQMHCELQISSSQEALFTLELHLMTLHVDLEDVQTFSGKSGEEEARKVLPRIREWTDSAGARTALRHAGQIFLIARSFEKTKLRDFYAVAVYHAALTMWVYGMVASNSGLQSGEDASLNTSTYLPSGGPCGAPRQHIALDGSDEKSLKAFTLLGQGVPGIHDLNGDFVPLLNCKAIMSIATALLHNNFPQSIHGLPALVANLASLLNELSRLSSRE
ncbi:benzoate 4-monooxygenase cytochrome-like protein P450 [Hortaea werneckii]|nr:benzoate 4-monooxygenase cytochrome-like protein P450 [Hortaea werneckii]